MCFQLLHPNAPTFFVLSRILISNKVVLTQRIYSNRALNKNHIYKTVFAHKRTLNHTIFQQMSRLIPKNQYDHPNTFAWTLKGMRYHWESIPVILSMVFAFILAASNCIWACLHKMDLVFKGDYQNSLSRTMDLRNPEMHKLMLVGAKYEPWPEMQAVLDAMRAVEELQKFKECDCAACAHSDEDQEECDDD